MKMKFEWKMNTTKDAQAKAMLECTQAETMKTRLAGIPAGLEGLLSATPIRKESGISSWDWMKFVKGLQTGLKIGLEQANSAAAYSADADDVLEEDTEDKACPCSNCIDKLITKMNDLEQVISNKAAICPPGPMTLESLTRLRAAALCLAITIEAAEQKAEAETASEQAVAEAEAAIRAATAPEAPSTSTT